MSSAHQRARRARGHRPSRPSSSGRSCSAERDPVPAVRRRRPHVVGHSFGGLIAQELLAHGYGRAAVAIDPAPVKGVKHLPFAQLKSGFPVLGNPANRKRTVALTESQFKYSFGNALTAEESRALFDDWTIPGPGRPLFEDATANFSRHPSAAVDMVAARPGPLLLISGSVDHTVPQVVTEDVYHLYGKQPDAGLVDLKIFEGRGHSLTMDHGWQEVAETVLTWLGERVPATDPEKAPA